MDYFHRTIHDDASFCLDDNTDIPYVDDDAAVSTSCVHVNGDVTYMNGDVKRGVISNCNSNHLMNTVGSESKIAEENCSNNFVMAKRDHENNIAWSSCNQRNSSLEHRNSSVEQKDCEVKTSSDAGDLDRELEELLNRPMRSYPRLGRARLLDTGENLTNTYTCSQFMTSHHVLSIPRT